MIAHVVLLRPRANLSKTDTAAVIEGFARALAGIPSIRRVQIGRRVLTGRGYEQLMHSDFPFAAVLEFDDVTGLHAYLEHPAHGAVGATVFAVAEEILVYDYEMGVGVEGLTALSDGL
jgi:hypothetical protein